MTASQLYNFEKLIAIRQDLHKHPELSFNENRTSSKIIEALLNLGIQETQIKRVAKTGLIVDIYGKAPASGKPFAIAIRADMDGLPIKEENPDLEYCSVTEAAHMCGHDSHMTGLIGGTAKILEKLDKIPSDKLVRLLFQPSEEKLGGALPMIQEGALEGIDEVYGFHNVPYDKPGKMYVKPGYMMARASVMEATIKGKGGHSSIPEQLKDPLQPGIDILAKLRDLDREYKDKGFKFVVNLPFIKTGDAPNAISDTCVLKGIFRSFEEDFTAEFNARVKNLIETTCEKYGCEVEVFIKALYPAVVNHEKETEHVTRVGKKVLGEGNILNDCLPVFVTEDFSYFTKVKPGAFFFLSSARRENDMLHSNNFNVNDDVIPIASEIWYRLVEDRFGLTF